MNPAGGSRLAGAMLAGALLVPLLVLAIASLLAAGFGAARPPLLQLFFSRALGPTGWIGLPVLGAGLGALASLGWTREPRQALRVLALALVLGVTGAFLVTRAPAIPGGHGLPPGSARAKARTILKSAFRSPQTVEQILHYTRDPDPVVREQAVLALGVNLVVAGIEGETREHPSPFAGLPLRDSIAARLEAALGDSSEAVRAEAARALWKAPHTFGSRPAAAETLAAVLDRARVAQSVERLAWLALDAAAGAPYGPLKAAAARFAAATPDSDLARAARRAAAP